MPHTYEQDKQIMDGMMGPFPVYTMKVGEFEIDDYGLICALEAVEAEVVAAEEGLLEPAPAPEPAPSQPAAEPAHGSDAWREKRRLEKAKAAEPADTNTADTSTTDAVPPSPIVAPYCRIYELSDEVHHGMRMPPPDITPADTIDPSLLTIPKRPLSEGALKLRQILLKRKAAEMNGDETMPKRRSRVLTPMPVMKNGQIYYDGAVKLIEGRSRARQSMAKRG
jgi:hypothetical protein